MIKRPLNEGGWNKYGIPKYFADEIKAAAPKQDKPADHPEGGNGWEVARVLKIAKPLVKGDDVKALQAALIVRGYHCGVTGVDGVYGRNTAYAVRCFQAANRLVVDGKAGRYTVTALGGVWKG